MEGTMALWSICWTLDQVSGPRLSPGQGNYVMFLGKKLNSRSASLHQEYMDTSEMLG